MKMSFNSSNKCNYKEQKSRMKVDIIGERMISLKISLNYLETGQVMALHLQIKKTRIQTSKFKKLV